MTTLRTLLVALALAAAAAPNAHAVVGGNDASEGEYPYVAHVTIDKLFQCTGTLVSPTFVVTAGHCSSLTLLVATPIGQPGQLIDVRLNSIRAHRGEGLRVPVKRVIVHPDYLFPDDPSYDVALLELAEPVDLPTVKIANEHETSLWEPGTLATIAGFGRTKEGGSQPQVLQEAQVPITTDEYAKKAYPNSFENLTQIGAGFEEGGVDTCQGDSGGPLLVPAGDTFRLVGDTSYGRGCARPGFPGIYGRLADTTLREWIRSIAPEAIAPTSSTSTSSKTKRGKGAQRKEAAQQRRGGSGSGSSSVGLR